MLTYYNKHYAFKTKTFIKLQNKESKEQDYTSSENLFAIVQWVKLVVIK